MSEDANIDYSGISEEEAEEKFAAIEQKIAVMEDKRQTQTTEFIELLREKLGLSQRLKKYQEVNNCEMRIRFIEARMRGEDLPQTDFVNLEHKAPRKKRTKTNTMIVVVVGIFIIMIGSVPMLKVMMDRVAERGDQIAAVGEDNATTLVPPNATPEVTPEATTTPAQTASPEPAATAPTQTASALPQGSVQEVNPTVGGKEIDLGKLLQPNRTTIFFFHSAHCPDCIQQFPRFKQLAALYPEDKFYTVDVDRPFSEEIDRDSPVCKQFGIDRYPYYMIFNGTTRVAVSKDAKAKVQDMYMARAK